MKITSLVRDKQAIGIRLSAVGQSKDKGKGKTPKQAILTKIAGLVLTVLIPAFAVGQEKSELATPPNGDAERAEVSQWIGPVKVSIEYHSPHVHNPATNDRTGHIWGELVHYGFVDEGFGPSQNTPWRAPARMRLRPSRSRTT